MKFELVNLKGNAQILFPGIMVSLLLAMAAQFLSDHYGAPAMLMALLLGLAFHFLSEEEHCARGISVSAKQILRVGVALLGARISVSLLIGLGPLVIALVIAGVVATISFGFLASRLLGRGWRFALLTSGSVAICGASAAMAIAAVLPKQSKSERDLIFTVLGVTILSTLAMVAYPVIARILGFDEVEAGVFLGSTIHDVAQVVGAGFTVSDTAGETATLVKLMRVTLLAPVVILIALFVRAFEDSDMEQRNPPLVPTFVIGFLALALANSLGVIPPVLAEIVADVSRWALLASIAAVGMKTSLKTMLEVPGQAIALIVAETIFLAGFVLAGLWIL